MIMFYFWQIELIWPSKKSVIMAYDFISAQNNPSVI